MLLILLLVVCLSGAFYFANASKYAPKEQEVITDHKGVITRLHKTPHVWEYHYETHDYIFNSYGGMVHSESCQCKETGY